MKHSPAVLSDGRLLIMMPGCENLQLKLESNILHVNKEEDMMCKDKP
jgi:hypothetical protein